MSKEAEKLAEMMDSRVVRNWAHSTGSSPKAAGFKHDAECQRAAALLRRQAEQIRELRDALELVVNVCGLKRGESPTFDCAFAALSNTKE